MPLRVPPILLVEPARWHEVAAKFWAERVADEGIDAMRRAWVHALAAGREDVADAMSFGLQAWHKRRGLYQENWGHAQRHVASFPEGFRGLWWAGECARHLGKFSTARRYMEKSESCMNTAPIDEQCEGAFIHSFALVLQAQGDLNGARARLERCLEILQAIHGTDNHPSVAASLHALGGVLRAQGDLKGARARLERCLEILQAIHGTGNHPSVAASLHALATVEEEEGRIAEAISLYERCLTIDEGCYGTTEHYVSAETEVRLAMLLFQTGCEEDAAQRLSHALSVLRTQVPNHPILRQFQAMEGPPSPRRGGLSVAGFGSIG